MGVQMIPIGAEIPTAVAAVLQSHEDAIREIQNPGAPFQLPVIDTAANLLLQAPADVYPNCGIIVTDKSCIAVSVDVAGTWTWKRADGGAL